MNTTDYKTQAENLRTTLLSYIHCVQKVQFENEDLKQKNAKLVLKVYELETILNIYEHRKMDDKRMKNDLISRQAVYDVLFDICNEVKKWAQVANDNKVKNIIEAHKAILIEMKMRIAKLPAIRSEPLTSKKIEKNFSGSKTPYEDISNYINHHINDVIDDYVVKIRLDGKTYTELLTYNGEYFEWLNDWYEGEKEIELIDFFPLEDAVRKESEE